MIYYNLALERLEKEKTMTKKRHIITLSLISIFSLIGCDNQGTSSTLSGNNFDDYVENKYCKTSIKDINDKTKYVNVGVMKTIQPVRKTEDGHYTTEGVQPVDAFNTNLIFSQYARVDLKKAKDVMDIESIIGPYTYLTHCLFDRHNYYLDNNYQLLNNLRVINENYGKDFITIDYELYSILNEALNITKNSNGKFNLFIGELSDFWDSYINKNVYLPADQTTDPAQTNEGKSKIKALVEDTPQVKDLENQNILEFKKENDKYQVRFNKFKKSDGTFAEKVSISLGGIGKGYLTENLYQKMNKMNLTNGNVYAGSSSIVIMNKHAYGSNWRIQVSNPYSIYSTPVGIVNLNEKYTISTSGSQVNSYVTLVDGQYLYRQHIINAENGYPADGFNMVTIFSKTLSSTIMDTLSTVLINCSVDEIESTITNIKALYNNCDLDVVLSKINPYINENTECNVDVYVSKNFNNGITFEQSTEESDGSLYSPHIKYHTLEV